MWVGRMLLESMEHPFSTFLTLTYNEEHCPVELQKQDLQYFIKRLREIVYPRKIRYYGVGEYGTESGRPHYHLIVFGMHPTETESFKEAWTIDGHSRGFIYSGTVEPGSISYTLGYMMKRLTKKGDERLNGKAPEFAIMSRKPGLGYGVVKRFVDAYKTVPGKAALKKRNWIEERFRSAGRNYPIGRYLKSNVLKELGFESGNIEAHNEVSELFAWGKNQGKTTLQLLQERKSKVSQEEGKINILLQKRRHL